MLVNGVSVNAASEVDPQKTPTQRTLTQDLEEIMWIKSNSFDEITTCELRSHQVKTGFDSWASRQDCFGAIDFMKIGCKPQGFPFSFLTSLREGAWEYQPWAGLGQHRFWRKRVQWWEMTKHLAPGIFLEIFSLNCVFPFLDLQGGWRKKQ